MTKEKQTRRILLRASERAYVLCTKTAFVRSKFDISLRKKPNLEIAVTIGCYKTTTISTATTAWSRSKQHARINALVYMTNEIASIFGCMCVCGKLHGKSNREKNEYKCILHFEQNTGGRERERESGRK